jgi:hypothetical protein
MKACTYFLLLAATGLGMPASGESGWSDVPASPSATATGPIEVPDAPSEAVVTLVSPGSPRTAPAAAPLRVFGTNLVIPEGGVAEAPAVPSSGMPQIPGGARWPDGSGRIAVEPRTSDPAAEARLRNPWQIRTRPRPAISESPFLCGGIVAGGPGGPIGILNGRVVKRGDSVGTFGVAGILADGVLLERGGTYFVLPRGKRTVIATASR